MSSNLTDGRLFKCVFEKSFYSVVKISPKDSKLDGLLVCLEKLTEDICDSPEEYVLQVADIKEISEVNAMINEDEEEV